ncbi:MAG TPA: EI24 domain-containing protein [Alphaproteobacteria bacterium]|nr:EI24 domain-containing protein [Alphaproteobacteria bacterium]
MFSALVKAFGQLGDHRLNWVIWVSVGAAILVMALLIWLVAPFITHTVFFELSWLNYLAEAAAGIGTVLVAWFLFPAVVTLVASTLLEYVSRAVEARHYPELVKAREQPFSEILIYTLKFTGIVVLVNIIVLPLYLLFPGLNFVLSWAINGYLLGREYFEMVAMRRMLLPEVKALRRQHGGRCFAGGVVIAIMMTVPILNLIAPVVATAFMTHVFEGVRRAPAGGA